MGASRLDSTLMQIHSVSMKTAKLFRHGGSQAVRLPKAFRFEGTEVAIERRGDEVVLDLLIAAHARSLGASLVTGNVREFRRVKRLAVTAWK